MPIQVFGLQSTREAPLTSIPDMASHYLQAIQKVQPAGPYKLAGYSFGATVAFEMARQLEHCGSMGVDSLTLLDGSPAFLKYLVSLYKARFHNEGNEALKETFAFCSFLINFMDIDFHKVGTATRKVTGVGRI